MKKILSMALVVCMFLSTLSLAGCGKKQEASALSQARLFWWLTSAAFCLQCILSEAK